MNKQILQAILNNYYEDIKSNEDLENIISGLETKLFNTLNNEETALFKKYIDAKTEEFDNLSHEYFRQGFRANIMLMLEVIQG